VIDNFKRPFFATSMADFWRRWHISLIKWLTDYIYTPLSFLFRNFNKLGVVLALMITFFISGIWHGTDIKFIVWGLMQGVFLSIEALIYEKRSLFEKKYNLLRNPAYIFLCVVITFILFTSSQIVGRADHIENAMIVFRKIFTDHGSPYLDLTNLAFISIGLLLLMLKDFKDEFYPGKLSLLNNPNIVIRYFTYLSLIFIIILFGVFKENSFIYFQF
jgi:D-alanyl-lipoteichoic acid acyltransferase DltB (MBOAT superfamily)